MPLKYSPGEFQSIKFDNKPIIKNTKLIGSKLFLVTDKPRKSINKPETEKTIIGYISYLFSFGIYLIKLFI